MFAHRPRLVPNWGVPMIYSISALVGGLTLPRIESHLLPGVLAGISPSAALAFLSSIASGMMALTGVVFSLVFVMIQFSAAAYSPRLSLWLARDRIIWHSLGMFTATFLYSLATMNWVDRYGAGNVPFFSAWLVTLLLVGSVFMFVALVDRVSLLQVHRMLAFAGDQGRNVIEQMYPPLETPSTLADPAEFEKLPVTQTLPHEGRPRVIQALDEVKLESIASETGAILEVMSAVGDTVVAGTVLLRVRGGSKKLDEGALREAFAMGDERTFEQDPKYALRLLADIGIKALSPAINDPTTAVQALDQIEDLLRRLGKRRLEIGAIYDGTGRLRLITPHPSWDDFIRLAFDEIRLYGATSIQVMRRMKALVSDLIAALPEEREAALRDHQKRLDATIARSFKYAEEKRQASVEDRQGLGVSRKDEDD